MRYCFSRVGRGLRRGWPRRSGPPYFGETLPGSKEYEFQPGMVFALEPLIWVEGVHGGGGVRLEEMVLITEGEGHVMSRTAFCDGLLLS